MGTTEETLPAQDPKEASEVFKEVVKSLVLSEIGAFHMGDGYDMSNTDEHHPDTVKAVEETVDVLMVKLANAGFMPDKETEEERLYQNRLL